MGSFSEKFISDDIFVSGAQIIPKQKDFRICGSATQILWGGNGNNNTWAYRHGIRELAQYIAITDCLYRVVIKPVPV